MQKISIILTVCISVFMLVGCGAKEHMDEPGKTSFNATVLEVGENFLLVEPGVDEEERKSCDKIEVGLSDMGKDESADLFRTIKVGDMVCITYNGEIMETYPGKIAADDIVLVESEKAEME